MRTPSLTLAVALVGTLAVTAQRPSRQLIGYWHNWRSSGVTLTLKQIPKEYDVVNIAFALPTTTNGATMRFSPSTSIYSTQSAFIADVRALQRAGKRVMISIGGGNHPVHVDTAAKAKSFATSMASIIKTYGFDGMDIDLEGSSLTLQSGDTDYRSPKTLGIVHFISGVNQLLAQFNNLMLTAAPETAFVQGGYGRYAGVWGAYLPVLHALRSKLSYVHVQHYNTGTMYGRDGKIYSSGNADFHVAMAESLLAGFLVDAFRSRIFFPALRPDQVAIGLPASTRAAGSGYTAATEVHKALQYLYLGKSFGGRYRLANAGGYPGFRGLMTWSINWDVAANQQFSKPHRAYLDSVFLRIDRSQLSQLGGTANLLLLGSQKNAGRRYLLLASLAGTSPGTTLPGGGPVLPLNFDFVSTMSASSANRAIFVNFLGTLNASGDAVAQFRMPRLPGTAGLRFSFAYALDNPWDFASTAAHIDIVR